MTRPRLKCPRCGTARIHPDASHGDDEGYARDLCDGCQDEVDALEADEDADWSDGRLDDSDHEDANCIDPVNCCNPHPFHSSSECETVEMHEAYERSLDEVERNGR